MGVRACRSQCAAGESRNEWEAGDKCRAVARGRCEYLGNMAIGGLETPLKGALSYFVEFLGPSYR